MGGAGGGGGRCGGGGLRAGGLAAAGRRGCGRSAALAAAFGQVGGVGGGLLAEAVIRAWDRLRARAGPGIGQSDLREALAAELGEALTSSSPAAAGLRAEVAGVLQGVDAVKVALTTTIETTVRESGDQVRAVLIRGLRDLGTRFTEFGWLLEEVNDQITRHRRDAGRDRGRLQGHAGGSAADADAADDPAAAGQPGARRWRPGRPARDH